MGVMMDTSKQNILMCEKAVEIQASWKIADIDIIVYGSGEVDSVCVDCLGYDHWAEVRLTAIWLPRQDQLQEMLRIDGTMLLTQVKDKYAMECWINKNEYSFERDSFEQLWLAFVMKEKYNKEWNGKDWQISE